MSHLTHPPEHPSFSSSSHYVTGEGLPADLRGALDCAAAPSSCWTIHKQSKPCPQWTHDAAPSCVSCWQQTEALWSWYSKAVLVIMGGFISVIRLFSFQPFSIQNTSLVCYEPYFNITAMKRIFTWRKLSWCLLNRWPQLCPPPLRDTASPQEPCWGSPACN